MHYFSRYVNCKLYYSVCSLKDDLGNYGELPEPCYVAAIAERLPKMICGFDDMYGHEYTMQWIYEAIRKAAIKREESQVTICAFPSVRRLNEVKHDIVAESQALLDEGHKEILQSECYEDYGVPSYIEYVFQHRTISFLDGQRIRERI